MAISNEIYFSEINNLFLDPMNPRLGRHRMAKETTQDQLLDIMFSWVLDELAYSYLESGGFWAHEPLIVVQTELYGKSSLVVVEGNRRLAALKYLKAAIDGKPVSPKWSGMVEQLPIPDELFVKIPYMIAETRQDVQAFLGFRHVTGIKQWDADEKAGFIANLIDNEKLSYAQVSRKIGSNVPTVRKHYIGYKLLLQIEDSVDKFVPEKADKRFAILYMSVSTQGVQQYLNIDIAGDPETISQPVPKEKIEKLKHFASWLFGLEDTDPIITDTRMVSAFGRILESKEATEYLENQKQPNFEVAYRISGGDEAEIIKYVKEAKHNIELALTQAHVFRKSADLEKAVFALSKDVMQLISIFPGLKDKLEREDD